MIRTCLEFLLSRALDEGPAGSSSAGSPSVGSPSAGSPFAGIGRPLASWVQHRLQRDVQLKQFDVETRQLDALLRSSATECRQAMASGRGGAKTQGVNRREANSKEADTAGVPTVKVAGSVNDAVVESGAAWLTLPPARQESSARSRFQASGISAVGLTGLAAAAVLLLVVSPSRLPDWFGSPSPVVHAGEFSQQLTVVPGEVLRLITRAAETSRTQLPQLSPLANLTLPALPAWEEVALRAGAPMIQEPLLREIDTWQESWKNFKFRLPASLQEI